MSYSCIQTNILAKFVDMIRILFYTQSYFMCHGTEYKLPAFQVRISEEINSTLLHSSS